MTPNQITARLRAKRESLLSLPDIPTLAAKRANLERQVKDLSQTLATARRSPHA